jgi:hypothetical protein
MKPELIIRALTFVLAATMLSASSCGGGSSYKQWAQNIVDSVVPPDPNAGQRLDISQFMMTFEENFRAPLSVTPAGPSKWIAHTFWNGDFGAAEFADPRPNFPFVTGPDGGQIIAQRTASGGWEAGLLGSLDSAGRGFEQAGGYFEARLKLPGGEGVWPAFWLGSRGIEGESTEIDVLEYYGGFTTLYSSSVHTWPKGAGGQHTKAGYWHRVDDKIFEDFHTYGVEIRSNTIIFYFDRVEYWRHPATPSSNAPMMILLNLAINSDPAKDLGKTPSPSILHVDYVRAYKRR